MWVYFKISFSSLKVGWYFKSSLFWRYFSTLNAETVVNICFLRNHHTTSSYNPLSLLKANRLRLISCSKLGKTQKFNPWCWRSDYTCLYWTGVYPWRKYLDRCLLFMEKILATLNKSKSSKLLKLSFWKIFIVKSITFRSLNHCVILLAGGPKTKV